MIDGGFHDRARGISKSVEIILDILLFWGYKKTNIKFTYFFLLLYFYSC